MFSRSSGRMVVTLLLVSCSALGTAQAQGFRKTIPEKVIRTILPADGEVVSLVLKKNQWPDNDAPFEKNETVEFALGKGIRAQAKHRKNEKSFPGFKLHDGYALAHLGWRLHKNVKNHNDYFDGTMTVAISLYFDDKQPRADLRVTKLHWNESGWAKLIKIFKKNVVEEALTKLRKDLSSKLETVVNTKVAEWIKERGLDLDDLPANRVGCWFTNKGLEVMVCTDPSYKIVSAQLPKVERFKLKKKPKPDGEFGGHGPWVWLRAGLKSTATEASCSISMRALETKSDHTEGSNNVAKVFFTAPADWEIKEILSPVDWPIFEKVEHKGHRKHVHDHVLGRFEIWGDRDGNDIPDYTGTAFTPGYHATILLRRQ